LIHTDKLWKGGEFDIELMNTHGNNLSEDYTGDIQVISNIERGNYTFLYQFLFTQRFSKGFISAGVHDLNTEFVTSKYGYALTNSSFAIPCSFALNFPVSIFPNCALAVAGDYQISDNLTLRSGIYDGHAGSFDLDPYRMNLSVFGFMSITEVEYHTNKLLNTTVKGGGYYISDSFKDPSDTLITTKGNYGFYLLADQRLIKNETRCLGIFSQISYAPKNKNYCVFYTGLGINLFAPFDKRKNDVVAFGIAYTKLFNHTFESDLEFNYLFCLNKYISIQPAFHYIVHPGADKELENAFAGFIRISAGL
jgi:porin